MGACFGVEARDEVIEEKLKSPKGCMIVDARPAAAFGKGCSEGAVNVPVGSPMVAAAKADKLVQDVADKLPSDKSAPIITHCAIGGEAAAATKALKRAGYTDVTNAGTLKRVEKIREKVKGGDGPAAVA